MRVLQPPSTEAVERWLAEGLAHITLDTPLDGLDAETTGAIN
jgi:hypothetical protein